MLSYLAIKTLLNSISESVIFDALNSNNPYLTVLLTELMVMNTKVESEASFTENDLNKLRFLLLTCYCQKLFHSPNPGIEMVTSRLYHYFFHEEKFFHKTTIDFSGMSFDNESLDLLFVNEAEDFGRALTIADFKGSTIEELSAARKLADRFNSLENINIPQLEISDVNDSYLLLFNRYAFVIDNTEVLIAALRQAGSFDNLTSSNYFSLAGYSLAGITCASVSDLREILSREGNLEGVNFPEHFHVWDLTGLFIDKINLQILITLGFPFKNLDPKHRANVHGLQFRSFAQIQEAIALNMDISQIDLSALAITESAQVELLINAKVALDTIALPATLDLQPQWLRDIPFEILTLTQYQKLIAKARKNTEKSLPVLPDELPRDKVISLLTNTQTILLHHWLREVITQDNLQDDFKNQLASSLTYFEPVTQTPMQYQLLDSLLTQYYKTIKPYQISPAWIRQLRQLLRKQPKEERLSKTAHDHIHAILSQHRTDMPKNNKFQDFERDPSALANQLFFILVWMLDSAGYSTQDLLPPSFKDIGLKYLDLKDIDINDIYITQNGSSLVVYRVSDLLTHLKNVQKFADPVKRDQVFSDTQVRQCFVEREDIRLELSRLHKLASQESKIEKSSINPVVLTALETLGDDLAINCNNGRGYNEEKANDQLITFHNFMKDYPADKALLDAASFPLETRSLRLTNFTQLFTEALHDGCTEYLSKSIKEWVKFFKAMQNFSINYSPYTHYMGICNSAETLALLSKQEKKPKFIIPEFYKNAQTTLAPQRTFVAEVIARAKLDRLQQSSVSSSSSSSSSSRHSDRTHSSSSSSTSSTFSSFSNAVNAAGTTRSSSIISSTRAPHSSDTTHPAALNAPQESPRSVSQQYPLNNKDDDDDNDSTHPNLPIAPSYPLNNYYDNDIVPPSAHSNTNAPHPPNDANNDLPTQYIQPQPTAPSAANS